MCLTSKDAFVSGSARYRGEKLLQELIAKHGLKEVFYIPENGLINKELLILELSRAFQMGYMHAVLKEGNSK